MPARKPEDCDLLLIEALNRGDLEAAVELHEPNASFLKSTGEVVKGLEGIRTILRNFLALKPIFTIEVTALPSGDDSLALTRASWSLAGTDANGQPVTMAAKSTEVVRRQADGSWLFAIIAPGAN